MDYTQKPRLFQVQKVLRYVRLYGPSRTAEKVRAQVHMKRHYPELPQASSTLSDKQTIGMIGCGNYAFSNIAYYLTKTFGNVIGACMDIDAHRAASLATRYRIPLHTTDAQQIIDHPGIKLIYIASNHASHAEYAIDALLAGKHVYIEKPHVVSEDQLRRLRAAMDQSGGRVFLGFNRPGSRFGKLVLEHLRRQKGAGMYSWFVAGHAIDPDHWYFRPEEGGRVLGNLCHWTDFVLEMSSPNSFPVTITPTRGAKSDSDIAVTYRFPDDTIAVITFSAKGHTFEGVREVLNAHRGDCLIALKDYEQLTIDVGARRTRYRNFFRDHGHCDNIARAYRNVHEDQPYHGTSAQQRILDTAWLFLKTREALESNAQVVVDAYDAGIAASV